MRCKKVVTFALAAVFVLASLGGGIIPCRADLLSSLQSNLNNYNQQYQSLSQQSEKTKENIRYLQSQASQLEGQLQTLNEQMQNTHASLIQKQSALAQLSNTISTITAQITSNKEKENSDRQKFDDIVTGIYKEGPVSYLQVLLGATSFDDFLTRLSYLTDIIKYDNKIMQELVNDRNVLTAQKEDLSRAQMLQTADVQSMEQMESQQKSQASQKDLLLGQVNAAKQKELADLNSESQAMNYLSEQIRILQQKYASLTGSVPVSSGWSWPVPGHYTISSTYGWRMLYGQREFHNGIDIAAPYGTPIVAANSGVVLYAGPAEGFGHWIVIQHSDHLMSVYGHMYASGIFVHPGEVVKAGQEIGVVGSDGNSTGPHLHFSIITGFNAQGYMITVNPLNYVNP